jgi:hypothetical protein
VLVSKKLVPDQKASIALPPRTFAMMGRATDKDVASNATMRVMMDSVAKASLKRHPGLNTGGAGVFEELCDELELTGFSIFISLSRCASAGGLIVAMVDCNASTRYGREPMLRVMMHKGNVVGV